MNIIIFDTETNGFKGSSVLSISAVKVAVDGDNFEILDKYSRYYFRNKGEAFNPHAIKVNGLSDDVILAKRMFKVYPEHFNEDIDSFLEFCGDSKHFVGHNIEFDMSFLPNIDVNTFCTMKTNTAVVKMKSTYKNSYKYPKLIETANFYGIELQADKLHDSMYDVEVTFDVLKKMCGHEVAKVSVEEFISS